MDSSVTSFRRDVNMIQVWTPDYATTILDVVYWAPSSPGTWSVNAVLCTWWSTAMMSSVNTLINASLSVRLLYPMCCKSSLLLMLSYGDTKTLLVICLLMAIIRSYMHFRTFHPSGSEDEYLFLRYRVFTGISQALSLSLCERSI